MPRAPVPRDVHEFLKERHPAVVSTVRPDGSPHAASTWYLWDGERVMLNMDRSRKRLAFLERDPRLALTVVDADNWGRSVTLIGAIDEFRPDPDLADIDRLALRFQGYTFEARVRDSVTAMMRIDSWHGWNVDHIWGSPGVT